CRSRALEQELGQLVDLSLLRHHHRAFDTEAAGDGGEIHLVAGQPGLAACLAEVLVVEHQDGEVLRVLVGNDGEGADAHQHLAVTRQCEHAARGLGERDTEGGRDCEAHAAPGVEVLGAVARGEGVPGRTAKAGNDERIAAALQQLGDEGAALDLVRSGCGGAIRAHFCPNPLAPITRWLTRTAAESRPWKARSAAAAKVSPTSAALSTGKHFTPMASRAGRAAC